MLMLLSVHMTKVLFIVLAGNSVLTMGVTCSYSSRPFLCALDNRDSSQWRWFPVFQYIAQQALIMSNDYYDDPLLKKLFVLLCMPQNAPQNTKISWGSMPPDPPSRPVKSHALRV